MTNSRPLLSALLLLASASLAAAAGDESTDQRFLAGLRQRGLYRLAETYCSTRLDPDWTPKLSDRRRADLVIELSRCLAERAVNSPPDVRAPGPILDQNQSIRAVVLVYVNSICRSNLRAQARTIRF